MVLAQSGEDAVVSCPNCRYGANVEKATSKFFDDEPSPRPRGHRRAAHARNADHRRRRQFLGKPTAQLVKTLVFDTDSGR
jgi:prolyl-tRNA synthetase